MVYTPKRFEVDALFVSPLSLLVFDLILPGKDEIAPSIDKGKLWRAPIEKDRIETRDT